MPTCLLGVAHINHLGIRSYENNNQLPCTCQPSPPKHRAANKEHCCTRVPPCDLESVVHGTTQPPCWLGEGCSTRRVLGHAREQGSAHPPPWCLRGARAPPSWTSAAHLQTPAQRCRMLSGRIWKSTSWIASCGSISASPSGQWALQTR